MTYPQKKESAGQTDSVEQKHDTAILQQNAAHGKCRIVLMAAPSKKQLEFHLKALKGGAV